MNLHEAELLHNIEELMRLFNHENSMPSLVKRYGKLLKPVQALPRGLKYGPMKECYRNAFVNMGGNFIYTEGYALCAGIPFIVEHAWISDTKGNAYDVTWRDGRGTAYYGVQFAHAFVLETAEKNRVAGIFGNNHNIIMNGLPKNALFG